jgi:hypothetical protein
MIVEFILKLRCGYGGRSGCCRIRRFGHNKRQRLFFGECEMFFPFEINLLFLSFHYYFFI